MPDTTLSSGDLRRRALDLYAPPFEFKHGYVFDSKGRMVADDTIDYSDRPSDSLDGAIVLRIRGWGRISYLPDAEALQDEVGRLLAEALTKFWADNGRIAL